MASIQELKNRIDLHDLASQLGLKRSGNGKNDNYHASDSDKNPSLSIFADGKAWKDFSESGSITGGDCISLVQFVEGIADVPTAMRRLHDIYNIPFDKPKDAQPRPERSKAEWIADQCKIETAKSIEYLVGRGIPEAIVRNAIDRHAVGFNNWNSSTIAAGEKGYGGPAAAFICRDWNTNMIRAVDFRYLNPEVNGGLKTKSIGDKDGVFWFVDREKLKRARQIFVVESAINSLCVESAGLPLTSSLATRGIGNIDNIDWSVFKGKQMIIALDADLPDDKGRRPGPESAWKLYDRLTSLNISALLVDQDKWYEAELNDVADIAKGKGLGELKEMLRTFEPWAIAGVAGKVGPGGKSRVFLPSWDYSVYWRYRCKPDFTTYLEKFERKQSEDNADDGELQEIAFGDVCGYRVAAISRVTIQSATATMSGEEDAQPQTLFAVTVQTPRHGPQLLRRVFTDERLHNVEHWKKVGPVFNQSRFLRLVNILERSANCGSREALNFVGLAWRHGLPVINEGPDCYFTEPEKQCPYHNLTFPSSVQADAKRVIDAYQETFRENAATLLLAWALGGHLKAFTGFWPHLIMQADKGSGKSTLVKRLERTIGMTMFGGQSLQTEFRLLTSVSHTSHPVGWEEISARKQDVINVAVAMLQESYQHTVTRRGSDMTEFLICAPVLLAGEDVPVRSLTGKVVRCNLTGRRGPLMQENLPRFPVRQWLEFLTTLTRERVQTLLADAETRAWAGARASPQETNNVHLPIGDEDESSNKNAPKATQKHDAGAGRMVRNYAVLSVSWRLLCEFAGIPIEQGKFLGDLRREMNGHIKETSGDREPWVWILELVFGDIESGQYMYPYDFEVYDNEDCLVIKPENIMAHIMTSSRLRDHWNALPIKSARVFKRQMDQAGVIIKADVDKRIHRQRCARMAALSLERLSAFGLNVSVPAPPDDVTAPDMYRHASND